MAEYTLYYINNPLLSLQEKIGNQNVYQGLRCRAQVCERLKNVNLLIDKPQKIKRNS